MKVYKTSSLLSLILSFITVFTWVNSVIADPPPSPNPTKDSVTSSPLKERSPEELAEAYYAAKSAQEIFAALKMLRKYAADHQLRWEVEAYHSHISLHPMKTANFAFNAIENGDDSSLIPTVHRAISDWPINKKDTLSYRLLKIAQTHPSPSIRAATAWSLRHSTHYRDSSFGYHLATQALGPLLPLSIIGTWDNDQGKGLDTPFPPEEEINLSGEYMGKLLKIKWRSQYPLDLRGKINLGQLLSPKKWQVAYGATAVEMKEATQAELRVSSTDPVKVWVNGTLVLSLTQLEGWMFDGLIIPVHLRKGVNQILIKSAQQTGRWMIAARLTQSGGTSLDYKVRSADTPADPGQAPRSKVITEAEVVQSYAQLFSDRAPTRKATHLLDLLSTLGLNVERLKLAERVTTEHPQSILLKLDHALALWEQGERGRAADLLNELHSKYGKDLPIFTRLQIQFWNQQQLDVKARAAARQLVKDHPKLAQARVILSKQYRAKGWKEEEFTQMKEAVRLEPQSMDYQGALAQSEENVGLLESSRARNDRLHQLSPHFVSTFKHRYFEARDRLDFPLMINIAQECTQRWPQLTRCYHWLADAHWSSQNPKLAFQTLDSILKINPLSANTYQKKGRWLLQLGQEEEALKAWELALERNPDNQKLSLRLSESKPKGSEPWLDDIPTEEEIKVAIKAKEKIIAEKGANSIYLMDDEVTLLKPDGSTISVTTNVIHAVNQEGRDDLTKMYIGQGSRTQLMAAYAISPDGTRIEASSIRKGVVRFRKLQVGSTVILQHRKTSKSPDYLVGHISKSWWFQNANMQVYRSRWVMWLPKGTPLKEVPRGDMKRTEEVRGDLLRVEWSMDNLSPVITEPRMPYLFGQVYGLEMSTVPSWEEVWKWEKELLREAFRMSPEVERLSDELLANLKTPQEKIYKIHEYVMKNIRYQQDYEHTIAGVKPHTAAQVLSRQYGDCKDKAVLFITLAQRAGLKAHFSLVRTRNAGPVQKELPSQQFNHAIVYVPEQEGIAEGRFYDPTVDELDVQSLRFDDQGTTSLVYNPENNKHYWKDIPFQDVQMDSTEDIIKLNLTATGEVNGELKMRGRGTIGQLLRKRARNPESFKQVMQYRVNQLIPGAQLLEHKALRVDDLYQPAEALMVFKHDSWIKREGQNLRVPPVIDWNPKSMFQLEKRRYPLVLGHHKKWSWIAQIKLPDELEVSHLPPNQIVESRCLSLKRELSIDPASHTLHSVWVYQSLCEQLSPKQYLEHRSLYREMMKMLRQEIVISPKAVHPGKELPAVQVKSKENK